MIRGTTPYCVLTVRGRDLTDKTVYVTFTQDGKKLTLTGDRLRMAYKDGATAIVVCLTQQETLNFRVGGMDVQARFIDAQDNAEATVIKQLRVDRVLLEEVIEHGE